MPSQPRDLVVLSRVQQALADARTIDEIRDIRDKAQLVKAYANPRCSPARPAAGGPRGCRPHVQASRHKLPDGIPQT